MLSDHIAQHAYELNFKGYSGHHCFALPHPRDQFYAFIRRKASRNDSHRRPRFVPTWIRLEAT